MIAPSPSLAAINVDNLLSHAASYRVAVLGLPVVSVRASVTEAFHGISPLTLQTDPVAIAIQAKFPQLQPTLSFIRRSPKGQVEPHFLHTDTAMGDWTGIFYLNPTPAPGDGTTFWRHRATGRITSTDAALDTTADWTPWLTVDARFNRLVLFPAAWVHSRALFENYGAGDDARLVQVLFGTGAL